VNEALVGLYLLVEAVDTPSFLDRNFPARNGGAELYKPKIGGFTCKVMVIWEYLDQVEWVEWVEWTTVAHIVWKP